MISRAPGLRAVIIAHAACGWKRGRLHEILSPLVAANRDADARASAALMSHLRTFDARHRTVIMVQVENEIGMILHARDYSEITDSLEAMPYVISATVTSCFSVAGQPAHAASSLAP
jgi:hypothetical protein